MKKIIAYLIFISLVFSCSNEKEQIIPIEFSRYVDMFFEEGNQRGLNVNLSDIDLELRFGTQSGTIAATCSQRDNVIMIDEAKWNEMSEEKKTWLIFHELGHCVLDREHRNDRTNNDDCISIMRGAEDNFDCSANLYSSKWWDYYLDELFDQGVLFSDRLELFDNYYTINLTTDVIRVDTISKEFIFDAIEFSQYNNFRIDFEFINWNTDNNFVLFNFGNIGFGNCDTCTDVNVQITANGGNVVYYQNVEGSIQFNSNVKLTIRKKGSDLLFFVNERFVHAFEEDLWSGNKIFSKYFDEPIQMKLTIDELE